VVTTTLVDLPVDTEGAWAMLLQPINTQIVTPINWVLGVDQWPGQKGSTIFRPTGDDGKLIETL